MTEYAYANVRMAYDEGTMEYVITYERRDGTWVSTRVDDRPSAAHVYHSLKSMTLAEWAARVLEGETGL